jgi:hypothetical protein
MKILKAPDRSLYCLFPVFFSSLNTAYTSGFFLNSLNASVYFGVTTTLV